MYQKWLTEQMLVWFQL